MRMDGSCFIIKWIPQTEPLCRSTSTSSRSYSRHFFVVSHHHYHPIASMRCVGSQFLSKDRVRNARSYGALVFCTWPGCCDSQPIGPGFLIDYKCLLKKNLILVKALVYGFWCYSGTPEFRSRSRWSGLDSFDANYRHCTNDGG